MLLTVLILQALSQRTQECSMKTTLIDLTEANYDQIIGGPRAVFVRMENQGCPYSVSSEKYWKEASELFPNVIFARAECIYNSKVCQNLEAQNSPSHVLFAPNSAVKADSFGNPSSISQSSSYYSQVIYQQLGFYPFDTATIDELIPESTNKFFSTYKYPVFLLYDSNCNEDSDFIAQWIIYATDETFSEGDYGFGKLDCSKYPEECSKWGATYPSANVFSREKAISASITETDYLSERVNSAIKFLDESNEVYQTPAPYVPPYSTPIPVISDVTKITVDDLENRNVDDIRTKYNNAKARTSGDADYTGTADVFSCNDVTLKQEVYSDSLKLVNFFRELAGVPANITIDENLNDNCYWAAKYSSRTASLSHDANDMYKNYCSFSEKWDVIKKTLRESNLANGKEHVLDLIAGQMDDKGSNNEGVVGHRRWLLYPYLNSIGVGFYPLSRHDMTGYYMQYPPSAVFGLNYGQYSIEPYDKVNFIAWPPAGPFPVERLPASWSVYYKEFQKDDVTIDDIIVKLTRDDGQILECSRIDLSKSTNGLPGQLIFKLTDKSIELVTAGHSVHAQIYLLKDEKRECLDYNIHFFDDQTEGSACFYNTDKSKCPSSIPDSNKFGKGSYSNFKPTGFSRTIINVVEDIQLTSDLTLDFSSTIIIKGNTIKGKMIIGVGCNVDIHDASQTDVAIKTDPNNMNSAVLRTPGKTKSVTIEFTSNPTQTSRFRVLVYVGSYADITYQKRITNGDYNYYFTTAYGDFETYMICTPVSFIEYACKGGNRDDYNIDSNIKCFTFSESNELKNIVTKKKLIRVYAENSELTISSSNLPDSYVDYEFLSTGPIKIEYSKALEHRAKSITVKNYKGGKIKPSFSVSELGLPDYDSLMKVYPFTNLYLVNLDESTDLGEYSIPYLLGDENAKAMMKTKETEVKDESQGSVFDENGYYKYVGDKNKELNTPLVITNGLHEEYTIDRSTDLFAAKIRIKPTDETISKPTTITIAKRSDINRIFQEIYLQNYQDLTIKTEKHQIDSRPYTYFQSIRLVNVSKVTFIDPSGQQVDSISTDVDGTVDLDVLATEEKPVTFSQLTFRNDKVFTAKNCKCSTANVAESNPHIKDIQITKIIAFGDSKPIIDNCQINNVEFNFKEKDLYLPTLLLRKLTNLPSSIKVIFRITYDYGYSKKIAALADSPRLIAASLNTELMEHFKNKISFYSRDDWNYEEEYTKYKAILSKDKKGLYLVSTSFNENNAPDSIPKDVEYSVSEENFSINPPPPPGQTPQATYPPQQTEISSSGSSSDDKTSDEPIVTTESIPIVTTESNPIVTTESNPIVTTETNPIVTTEQIPTVTTEPIPIPTPEPDHILVIEVPENSDESELDEKLKEVLDDNDETRNHVVVINNKNINFNSELKDNQFIKPAEDSTVNYNGGNLNLAIPGKVTVVIDDSENSKLSFKGEGEININMKEDSQTESLNFNRNSNINGSVTLTVPSNIKSVTIESLNLESKGELKVLKNDENNNQEKVELAVNNINANYNSNAVIKDLTIKNSLNVVQTALLNIENVVLEDATVNYEIHNYDSLKNPIFKGTFNNPPSSIVLKRNEKIDKPSKDLDYTFASGLFEKEKCEEWLDKIDYGNSFFTKRNCLDNTQLDYENKRIVLHYSAKNDNGGKGKLGKSAIIGIVVGVIVVVVIVVVVVIIILIKRKRKYENSTEGADLDGLDKQNEQQQNTENKETSNEQPPTEEKL